MKLTLLAVGTKMPAWVTEGFQEYAKRMPRECQLILQEIAPAKRGKTGSATQWIEEEADRLLQAIPANQYVVALEVKGKAWSTEALSHNMANWLSDGRDVTLLVGGPDGLSERCRQKADQLWSLSPLTMPHPIVRVVLAEQLYRAWTILNHHPYHRA